MPDTAERFLTYNKEWVFSEHVRAEVMMKCDVEVKKQGSHVTNHIVEAATALAAINLVEIYYGAPLKYETISLEDERKRRRPCLLVNHWHGYTFEARVVNLVANDEVNRQPVRELWQPLTL